MAIPNHALSPDALLQRSIQLHQAGQLDEAAKGFEKLKAHYPKHTIILNHLAIIYLQKGQLKDGVKLLEKSIAVDPKQPDILFNYAKALDDLDKSGEALRAYDRVLAISPKYLQALQNRGILLSKLGKFNEALKSFNQAIALDSNNPSLFFNKANLLKSAQRYDEAITCFNKAIDLDPQQANFYNNLGLSLLACHQADAAITAFLKAKSINPRSPSHHLHLGIAYLQANLPEQALICFQDTIALIPSEAEPYNNAGLAYHRLNAYSDAIDHFTRALAIQANFADAYSNRGLSYQATHQYALALDDFNQCLSLAPHHADAHWNRALLYIQTEDFIAGWKEYEWRWKSFAKPWARHYPAPVWDGNSSLKDKHVVVYPEQGYGDFIMMSRYLPLLVQQGAILHIEHLPPLQALISSLSIPYEVVQTGEIQHDIDYQLPIMSLPMAFKTTVTSIPNQMPYLFTDDNKVAYYTQCMGGKSKPRIGIAWSGSSTHKNDLNRSIPLAMFAPLLNDEFEFYVLQNEIREADKPLLASSVIKQFQSTFTDFSDTAAFIQGLDLVITVDTSVAHLAGSMGKPVWILLPYNADYRWLIGRCDTPWYPSARLFRQTQVNDWISVFNLVSIELNQLFSKVA